MTENHEEPEPDDLREDSERKEALDLTDLLDPQLEEDKAGKQEKRSIDEASRKCKSSRAIFT